MELIAASQIAKAQSRIAANRPFRDGMARLMQEIVTGDPVLAKTLFAAAENVVYEGFLEPLTFCRPLNQVWLELSRKMNQTNMSTYGFFAAI